MRAALEKLTLGLVIWMIRTAEIVKYLVVLLVPNSTGYSCCKCRNEYVERDLVLDKRIWPPVLLELKECFTKRRKSIFSFTFIFRCESDIGSDIESDIERDTC